MATVGEFTLREETDNSGACGAPTVQDNSTSSGTLTTAQGTQIALAGGGSPEPISTADQASSGQSFSAILTNGSSQVSGDVTYQTVAAQNACVTTGSISGR